jgi:multidrug efflux pump subunit AcrB
MLRDMPNDVHFKVGLITIMGLSAKNVILSLQELRNEGRPTFEAAVEAAYLRIGPILMTLVAFAVAWCRRHSPQALDPVVRQRLERA